MGTSRLQRLLGTCAGSKAIPAYCTHITGMPATACCPVHTGRDKAGNKGVQAHCSRVYATKGE